MELEGFDRLIREAQRGDRVAADRLLASLRPQVERVARDYADPANAVESVSDLVQEAELRAWQGLEQFRGGADDQETLAMLTAWVQQITRRVGLNAIKARQALRRKDPDRGIVQIGAGAAGSTNQGASLDLEASGSSPSTRVLKGERAQLVHAALESIPDETDRAIVRLCFFEGLSFGQISARVGYCYETVRQRYHDALGRMESQLKGRL